MPNLQQRVKNIIAVASGKGGVGKSTTAVNLALALHAQGQRVGIMDADIYGPNQPQMLGANEQPVTNDEKLLTPVMSHGIQSMSIGYLIDQETPMIWRGPMVTNALQQLLNGTAWDNLDYLIIDLPPGTGDVQLTLTQKIPLTGAIIVTTPQDIALLDVRKAIAMFQKVHVPIIGVVENMSLHTCTHCGHTETIFGEGGGKQLQKRYDIELLGELPLAKQIREHADDGKPIVAAQPENKISKIYNDIAAKVIEKVSALQKTVKKFPKIVIEK
jgi:ATP-binding protein involved in chromosome partitioning